MGDFKNLVAWQEANALANDMHAAYPLRSRRDFPGLRAQLLKAAGSIADCLAEGCGKRSRLELARFAGMAYTSAQEVQSQLIRARACRVLSTAQCDDFDRRAERVAKLWVGLSEI
jgi:four helix bundle protein